MPVSSHPEDVEQYGLVAMSRLRQFFAIASCGCPTCGATFKEQAFDFSGVCIKVTLLCTAKHATIWNSSPPSSPDADSRDLILNRIIPVVTVMSGISIQSITTFLKLLGMKPHDASYMKKNRYA